MEICLSPSSSAGIGCDNMTVIIIALLNGRSKEEWYAWIKDRVAQQYGYDTPEQLPRLYAHFLNDPVNYDDEPIGPGLRIPAGGLGGLARALANGPISFHPGLNEHEEDTLEFERYDSDEEESEEDANSSASFLNSLRRSKEDVTKLLLARLEEERNGIDEGDLDMGTSSHHREQDAEMDVNEPDGDAAVVAAELIPAQQSLGRLENKKLRQGEAPLPPLEANSVEMPEQPQLTPQTLSGDAPSGAVKVEGLNTSESPFKTD